MRDRAVAAVEDILRNATLARTFVGDLSPGGLAGDQVRLYGVLHALTLIGEAAKRVPPSVRARFPDIPWRAMAGMRDVVVHQYDALDVEAVHRTALIDAAMLIERLPPVIASLRATPDSGSG